MREVMNTVGKSGKLGEPVRCVVSVSMLTEGWDANTVTHILGVRAFGTQLLCEQVVGRGLRRRSYEPDENGLFTPEYADVYGVPFQFMPTVGKDGNRTIKPTRSVHALPERKEAEISFPRVAGYRLEHPRRGAVRGIHRTVPADSEHGTTSRPRPMVSGLIGASEDAHARRTAGQARPGGRIRARATGSWAGSTPAGTRARGTSRRCCGSPSGGWPSA